MQAFGRLWRKFVVAECPDEIRKKRIRNILHDVVMLETMRRWERENYENKASQTGKANKYL